MNADLRILLLENVPTDAQIIEKELRDAGLAFSSHRVGTLEDYNRALKEFSPDIVLAENSLPAFDALGALALARQVDPLLPVVIVSRSLIDEQAVELLRAGARDYVLKDRLSRLVPAVKRALAEAEQSRLRNVMVTALQDSEQRFRMIFEQAAVGIAEASTAGRYLTVNERLCEITGYTSAELQRQSFRDLIHPNDFPRVEHKLKQLLAREIAVYSSEQRCVRKDGSIVWSLLIITPVFDAGGTICQLVTILEDASARKAAESAFYESEERYRLLFTSSQDGFLTFDAPDWRLTSCNPAAVTLFGAVDATQLFGTTPWQLSPDQQPDLRLSTEKSQAMIAAAVLDGSQYFEWTFRRFDGSTFEATVLLTRLVRNNKTLLNASIRDTTERKRARVSLHEALIATVEAIAATMETRDPYTAGHQKRVSRLAAAIAREMGLADNTVEGIRFGALIHDLGKIQVPAELLSKPGVLSRVEFELIKLHPQTGYDIVKDIKFPWPVADMVYQHHERLDGSGYPRGLKGDAITLEARILAVADVVEAMSSHRPYRPGLGIEAALQEIENNKNAGLDPAVVEACLRLFREKALHL